MSFLKFPYGEKITKERLQMIDRAEQFLLDMGFRQVRVRFHKDVARIEVTQDSFEKIIEPAIRDKIYTEFKNIGFMYTALVLKGYRTGSMNEGLSKAERSYRGHKLSYLPECNLQTSRSEPDYRI